MSINCEITSRIVILLIYISEACIVFSMPSNAKSYFSLGQNVFVSVGKKGRRPTIFLHIGHYSIGKSVVLPKHYITLNLKQFERLLKVKDSILSHCSELNSAVASPDELPPPPSGIYIPTWTASKVLSTTSSQT